ncbi:YybS family protein [Peribacillus tepidiphilus]|uniref:YybS family protein n=1 Tax=Peribacillus tepidiphilus TaxID=2652445 RepID=UPI001290961F|nr:YybS family protein [Peribacillus tepidiphilus]
MNNGRRVAESGVLLAIFSMMLFLSMQLPILGTIIAFFLPVPFILVSAKYSFGWALGFTAVASVLAALFGTILSVPMALIFGTTGITIGYHIQKNKSSIQSYISAVLVFLVGTLIFYGASVIFFEINFIDESIKSVELAFEQSLGILNSIGQGANEEVVKSFKASLDMVKTILPSLLVISSMIVVLLFFLAANPIVKRFTDKRVTSVPFREIKLPKSLLWYYLIVIAASFVLNPERTDFTYTVLSNLLFILQFFMLIQGYSFIFFYSHLKRWSKAVPITALFLSFVLPILLYIIRILGIIDLGFNLRERVMQTGK